MLYAPRRFDWRRWALPAVATAREARVISWEGVRGGNRPFPPRAGALGCGTSRSGVLLVGADLRQRGPVRVEVVVEELPPLLFGELLGEHRALVAQPVEVDPRAEVP